MLSFIGVGNAFCYELGNCSAFYIKDNSLLLIDCDKIGLKNVVVMYPNLNKLTKVINLFGVNRCNYILKKPSDFGIIEVKQEHSFMDSFGYLFEIDNKRYIIPVILRLFLILY